jgi:hypothetical protein
MNPTKQNAELRRITEKGLESYRRLVAQTAKTLPVRTGETEPNPNYAEAVRRLEAAQYHYDTWSRIREKGLGAGYEQNLYDGTCAVTGRPVKAGAGFRRKIEGRWRVYSFPVVLQRLGITIEGLPEID